MRRRVRAMAEPSIASAVVSTTTTATANAVELRLACETFIPSATTAVTLRETTGGVNNHVRYADAASGTYVARVYNNGRATTRVAFEHAVLLAVEPLVAACDLGFVVPRALRARDGSGDTFKILPSGDAASVFELIPGTLPKTRYADAVGEATAALSKCLEACEGDVRAIAPTSPTSVYRDIFGAFVAKGGSREAFFEEMANNSGLDDVRPAVTRLADYIRALEEKLLAIEAAGGLPETLIHGDVHYDNALVDENTGKVTGIIDFEFASYDWRMMECAAGLSKYVGEKDPMPFVQSYIKGFCRRATPTEAEIDAIPDLIKLRVLETVVYFVARSVAGEDDISQLALRADNYAARVEWIDANAQAIRDAVRASLASRQ